MVTITDVAREADVSIATVSRVLNNSLQVMPTTRERVLAAVDKLGYEMSLRKKAIQAQSCGFILVVTNTTLPTLNNHVAKAAASEGMKVIFFLWHPDDDEPLLELLQLHHICGILWGSVTPPDTRLMTALADYPVVELSGNILFPGKPYRVIADEKQMAFDAVSYLLKTGCKNITMLSTASTIPENTRKLREDGYLSAIKNAGLQPQIVYGDYTYDGGYRAARDIFAPSAQDFISESTSKNIDNTVEQKSDTIACDGIFCICDMMAVGCLNYLHEAAIAVPEAISVISLDNMEVSEFTIPPLTTMDAGSGDVAREAVKLLRGILDKEYSRGRTILINHELILRQSTRKG